MLKKLRASIKQKGQSIVEYAILLAFVAVVSIGLLGSDGLKKQVSAALTNMTSQVADFNKQFPEQENES